MLPLTLASKSCCHHKVIYSFPSRSQAHCAAFLKHKHTQLHPDCSHAPCVCVWTCKYPHVCMHDQCARAHSHRGALVFCHFLALCCSEVFGAALQTNHFTGLGFDLCFQELWFCWAKQLAAPNSISVPPWKGRVIIFGWGWGGLVWDWCFHRSSHLCKRKLNANKEDF